MNTEDPRTDPAGGKQRQRVSVACLSCRKKRVRCDGTQPTCGLCLSKGVECEYHFTENKRKPPSKRYVESLLARIKSLEDQLTALGQTAATFSSTVEPAEDDTGAGDTFNQESPGSSERDPVTEVSTLMGRLNVGSDGQLHYFGSQSNYHLLHSRLGENTPVNQYEIQQHGVIAAAKLNKTVSIPRELRDHLLDLYWKWQNSWNYVIHREAFLRDLESHNGKYCSPLLLSAVLALASRYSDCVEIRSVPDNPNTAGDAFAEQAKILLMYETEAPTVTTVQAVALMALRAMSDNKDSLGWLYCGNATRMAFNIGLNLHCTHWVANGMISEEEAEVRKITWWGVNTIDKLFSIALGRPGTTKKSHVTCPRPTIIPDVEYGPWLADLHINQSGPAAHSRMVSAAYSVSESLTIATEAMDDIYAPNNRLSTQTMESIIGKADMALQMYYTALPSFLRLPSSPRVSTLPHIYQLHIQYHVSMILLHRPLIKQQTQGKLEDSSVAAEQNMHMKACRHSATEVVKILRIYKHFYTLRRIAIVIVHNAFTAAVIHLLDVRSRPDPFRKRSLVYLHICIEALQDLSVAWCAWSHRALKALQILAKEWLVDENLGFKGTATSTNSPEYGASQYSAIDPEESLAGLREIENISSLTGTTSVLAWEDIDDPSNSILYPAQFSDADFSFLFEAGMSPGNMDEMTQLWLEGDGVFVVT